MRKQKMLECREYNLAEITTLLGTKDKQGTSRKLSRLGVTYTTSGRGENIVYTIQEIKNPFKLHCVLDLGMNAAIDFEKLMWFFYYFLNDDDFCNLTDQLMHESLEEMGITLSRETIGKYRRILESLGYVHDSTDYLYYFAYRGNYIKTERSNYLDAWKIYHDNRDNGCDW